MKSDKSYEYSHEPKNTYLLEINRKTIRIAVLLTLLALVINWMLTKISRIFDIVDKLFDVISPLIVGFCIAFIINLILRPAEKLWDKAWGKLAPKVVRFRRFVCLTVSTVVVGGILFSMVFMFIPLFRDTLSGFIDAMPSYMSNFEKWINDIVLWLTDYGFVIPELNLNVDKIIQPLTQLFARHGSNLVDKTVGITTSIFSGIIDAVLAFVFSMYMLAYKERFCAFLRRTIYAIFPIKFAKGLEDLVTFTGITFSNFVTGQLVEAVIIGVLCFFGMLIFNIPHAAVISVLVAFTALIPVVGAFVGTAIGAFLILLVEPIKAVWFVVFIIILQQIESNLIYPRVVGKSVGLPGILVLASVTIAGDLFGIAGMLVSVPLCSVIYTIFKGLIEQRFAEKRITFYSEHEEYSDNIESVNNEKNSPE